MKYQIYYDSYQRFTNRIEKYWIKNDIRYNSGNLQLLKYAWRKVTIRKYKLLKTL